MSLEFCDFKFSHICICRIPKCQCSAIISIYMSLVSLYHHMLFAVSLLLLHFHIKKALCRIFVRLSFGFSCFSACAATLLPIASPFSFRCQPTTYTHAHAFDVICQKNVWKQNWSRVYVCCGEYKGLMEVKTSTVAKSKCKCNACKFWRFVFVNFTMCIEIWHLSILFWVCAMFCFHFFLNGMNIELKLNETTIQNCKKVKYLGIVISSNFRFIDQIEHILNKVNFWACSSFVALTVHRQ